MHAFSVFNIGIIGINKQMQVIKINKFLKLQCKKSRISGVNFDRIGITTYGL